MFDLEVRYSLRLDSSRIRESLSSMAWRAYSAKEASRSARAFQSWHSESDPAWLFFSSSH